MGGAIPAAYTPRHLAERILSSRSALEGEHKALTVLFCDLCDSTGMATRLGPENMHAFLDRFFERVLPVIHRYEGTINQFLGDGFMALFGAPVAIEEHARRALLAAMEIRRVLADATLTTLAGAPVQVRMGLNTGAVVVGKIGDDLRMDYTAVGDTTNTAARLTSSADPGQIVLSDAVRRLAPDVVRVTPLGPLPLKGHAEPVQAWAVIGPAARPAMSEAIGRRRSPFVGRDRELAALQSGLGDAERGVGALVGIVGEPGIGKSRLVGEFHRALAQDRVTFLVGRCLPYTQAAPYALVIDLLHANCGVADDDPPAIVADKVRVGLAEVGLADEDRVDALLVLLGIDAGGRSASMAPEVVKRRALDTLRALVLRGGRRRPLVMVLEDLHWVDRASEDFFADLAEAVAATPLLLVATYRQGYAPAWIGHSWATQIALRPLSAEDSTRIVAGSAPGADGAIARTILDRAEGNPFFLEELSRALTETPGSADGAVPVTIQGVLAARIDRLSEHSKRLLQVAAVIGREFSSSVLEAVWDGPLPLDVPLRELTRAEFIHARADGDEGDYVFRHALTHDVTYMSLLERHRRTTHRAVGATLEALHAASTEPVIELLAHHYGLSDDGDRAVDCALRAGDKARRRWANAEALAHFAAALARLETLPASRTNTLRRIDAVLAQAEVKFALGEQAGQLDALDAISALVEEVADPPRRATWHYWMGFLHSLTGSPQTVAVEHCERAAHIARASGDTEIEARAQSCLAQVYLVSGDLRRGTEVGEAAAAEFETRGDLWWLIRTLGHLSPIANGRGEWDRALGYGQRALTHAKALEDRRQKIAALYRIASTLIQRGDPTAGLRFCDEAEGLGPGPFDAAAIRAIRGHGLVKAGDVAGGSALLEEIVAWLERSQLRYTHGQVSLWLGEAYVQAERREAARALLEATVERTQALGYRHLLGVACRLLAEALGASVEAPRVRERAVALLAEVGARSELAKAERVTNSQGEGTDGAK